MGPARIGIVVTGLMVFLAGTVFTLQGFGVVGPPASFMYQNGQWVYNGAAILVVGIAAVALGFTRTGARKKV